MRWSSRLSDDGCRGAPTPLAAVAKGAAAGAVGTLVMDLVLYGRFRRQGGDQSFLDWELSAGLDDWEGAPAPALVAKRVVEGMFQVELEPRWARVANNATHWAYGLAWGAQYGILAGSVRAPRAWYGLALGTVAWLSGYVVLPLAGLYKPIWEYDARTLGRDYSAHLAYGAATGLTFRVLAR